MRNISPNNAMRPTPLHAAVDAAPQLGDQANTYDSPAAV